MFFISKRIKKCLILIAVGLIGFSLGTDFTNVDSILPQIQNELRTNSAQLKLIVLGFSILFSSFLVIMDYLSNCYGRKKFLILNIILLNLVSLGASFAKSANILILTRSLQGLFAATIIPCVTVLIADTFTVKKNQFNLFLGIYGSLIGIGIAFGPFLGETIAKNFDWRLIFLINIPFTLISLIIFIFLYDEFNISQRIKFDWLGSILCFLTLGCITFFICEGEHYGWISWPIISLLILGLMFFFVIYLHERKISFQSVSSLYLFRNTDFFKIAFIYFLFLPTHISPFLTPFYLMFYFADLPIEIIKEVVITKGALNIESIKNILKDRLFFMGNAQFILKQKMILNTNKAENFSQYNIYRKLDDLRLRTKLSLQEMNTSNKKIRKSENSKNSHHLSEPIVLLAVIILGVLFFIYVLMGLGVGIISSIILWLK